MKRTPIIGALATVLLAAPCLVNAAYYYEAVTTTANGDTESVVHAWVDGDKSRVKFVEGQQFPGMSEGSYLVTHDGGKTLYLIDPANKTVSKINLNQIFQAIGRFSDATNGLVDMQFKDFSAQKLGEKAGETLLGYPTTHYHYKTGYTMAIKVFGFARESRVESDLNFDCSKELDDAGFGTWLRPDRFRTGNKQIDSVISQAFGGLHCLPLRNTTKTTVTQSNGKTSTHVQTTAVTTIREADAPAGVFEVPADYKRQPLIPTAAATGSGEQPPPPDFGQLVQQIREGVQEGAKEQAKQDTRQAVQDADSGLRGLLDQLRR